jgi:hypothetical protein
MVVKFGSKPLIFRGWPRIRRPQRMARLVLRRIERRRRILSAWQSRLNRRDINKKNSRSSHHGLADPVF